MTIKTKIPIELIAGKLIITGSIDVEGETNLSKEQIQKTIEESIRDTFVGPYVVYFNKKDQTNRNFKISAIKTIRQFIGCGLKDAKDFVERSEYESFLLPGQMRLIEAETLCSRLFADGYVAKPYPAKFALFAGKGISL